MTPSKTLRLHKGEETKQTLGIRFQQFQFPGGDPHIKINPDDLRGSNSHDENVICDVHIQHRISEPSDTIMLLLAVDALRREGVKDISLYLPCLPAARQDRVCVKGEPLTSKVFATLINSCGFSKVTSLTPHSDVMPALIDNFDEVESDARLIFYTWFADNHATTGTVNIVSPDGGALKRVAKIAAKILEYQELNNYKKDFVECKINVVRGDKSRDVATGKLTGFEAHTDSLGGHPTLIVDDINCNGGTFRGLAAVLMAKQSGDLSLYTTHSDCVKGIENVCEDFEHVYTTNSKKDWAMLVDKKNFTCIPVI